MTTVLADRYELGRLLGRGGMADVYLAQDRRLNRQVAVKMLHKNLSGDRDLLARFQREAHSSARLNHHAIVTTYDSGAVHEEGFDQPFIVMEYIDGRTVREVLDEARRTGKPGLPPDYPVDPQHTQLDSDETMRLVPPSPREDDHRRTPPLEIAQAGAITSGVLSALAYSHRQGVVHRDIKPGNVMLTDAGDVKVMDFGIARAASEATAAMTRTNTVLGTAQYLSPEQARGETVDSRSDLYSTGCLLYELLTGRPPFVSDSAVSLAYKHVGEIPEPPSRYNPLVSEAVDRVVMMSLAKDRGDRYQDAESFRADLTAAQAGRAVQAPPLTAANADDSTQPLVPVPPARPTQPARPTTTYTERVSQEPQRKSRVGAVLLTLLLVAAGIAAGILGYQMLANDEPTAAPPTSTPTITTEMVEVPDVANMTLAQATTALNERGLQVRQGTSRASDTIEKGKVVAQDPPSNKAVERGSTVTVALSLGPAAVEIPDVRGMTQERARETLQQHGLEVGNVDTRNSASVRQGLVISTDPAAGASASRGDSVSLVLSSGRVTVEDLTGRTMQEAHAWLTERGLEVVVEEQQDESATAGTVLRQEPPPGDVDQGSTVTLYVAVAPTAPTTEPSPTDPGTEAPPTEAPPPTDAAPSQ